MPERHAKRVLLRARLHANGHVSGGNRFGGGRHLLEVLHHLLHRSQETSHFAVDMGRNRHRHVTAREPISDVRGVAEWIGEGSCQEVFGEQGKHPQESYRA